MPLFVENVDANSEKIHYSLTCVLKTFSVVCFTSIIFYLSVHFCCPKGITEPVDLAKNNGNAPQEYQVASEILPGKISLSSCPWLLTLVISWYSTQFLAMYNDYRICEYPVLKYSIVVHVQIKLQRVTMCLPQGQFLHKTILTVEFSFCCNCTIIYKFMLRLIKCHQHHLL